MNILILVAVAAVCGGVSVPALMLELNTGSVTAKQIQANANQDFACKFNLQVDGQVENCSYTLDVADYRVYPWSLNVGLNSMWLGGPAKDADGTVSGGFVFADLSSFTDSYIPGFERKAWFVSDVVAATTARGRCLNFQFAIDGLNLESLSVIRVDILDAPSAADKAAAEANSALAAGVEGETAAEAIPQQRLISVALTNGMAQLETSTVWSWEDSTKGVWKKAKLSYSTPRPHFFIVEVVPKNNIADAYRGYVALDNIELKEGLCDNSCNFDAVLSTCAWENSAEDNFDWSISRGSRKSFTGPIRDQGSTQFSGTAGGFAFIDSGYPRHPGDTAILKLKNAINTNPDEPLCLVFYVNMFGSGMGSLSLVEEKVSNSNRSTLWELVRPASSPRDVWHKAQVTISSQEQIKLFFEASVGETGRGDIAIDTLSMEPGPCVIQPNEAARYKAVSCSFNSDLCGYLSRNIPVEAGTQGPPLWLRVKGGGARVPRGHRAIRSGEEDWFAMFDVKNYQHRPLDRGFLIGPQVPMSTEPLCVSFWYYMATDVTSVPYLGTLRVMLIPRNKTGSAETTTSTAEPRVIWSLSNQQEAEWNFAQVSFTPDHPYLLTFEGIRASNVLGVIGIDDIALFPGACTIKPEKSAVSSGDCSFEFDTCGWKPLNPGSALDLRPQDWKLADRNQNFGNFRDHTFKLDTSGYIYFDTINIQTKTWLISPRVEAGTAMCLQFYFATAASDTSNLQLRRQFSNGTMGDLWSVQYSDLGLVAGTALSAWMPAQVFVPALQSESAVVFEGNSNDGGFALDDIVMKVVSDKSNCATRPLYATSIKALANPFRFASLQSSESRFNTPSREDKGGLSKLIFRRGKALEQAEVSESVQGEEES